MDLGDVDLALAGDRVLQVHELRLGLGLRIQLALVLHVHRVRHRVHLLLPRLRLLLILLLLGVHVILISLIDLAEMKDGCGGVIAREDLVSPVQLLELGLPALANLRRHLVLLALRRVEILSRVVLRRVVDRLWRRRDIRHRLPTARYLHLLLRVNN